MVKGMSINYVEKNTENKKKNYILNPLLMYASLVSLNQYL